MENGRSSALSIPYSPFSIFFGVQAFHRLVEIAFHRQRQHIDGGVHRSADRRIVLAPCPPQHPGHHAILMTGMTDANA